VKAALAVAAVCIAVGCEAHGGASDREDSRLIAAEWVVAPGEEQFLCALVTVPEDVWVRGFEAVAPPGTHHMLLTRTSGGGSDGVFPCEPGTLSDVMLFASGVSTDAMVLPAGVAMFIPGGSQLLLNLHLLNVWPEPRQGRSGVRLDTVDPSAVEHEAEMLFAGPTDFVVRPGTTTTATGACRFEEDATVHVIWPHMHTLGRHMQVVHRSAAGAAVLHDSAYDFDEQRAYPIAPTLVRAGETLEVTCTWNNPTEQEVRFGDSTFDEMCFAGLVRHPAAHRGLYCNDASGAAAKGPQ